MNFSLNLPTKRIGTFNLWGVAGISKSDDADEKAKDNSSGQMGVAGLSHKISTGESGYFYSVVSVSNETNKDYQERYINNKEWVVNRSNIFSYKNIRLSTLYNYKFNTRLSIKSGLIFSNLGYEFNDDRRDNARQILVNYIKEQDRTQFFQAYSQFKVNVTSKLLVTGGIHFSDFLLNNNKTFEPRFGAKYQLINNQTLTFSYGMHSRLEPISVYLLKKIVSAKNMGEPNKNLKLSRASHFVMGYGINFSENLNLKIEAYYQNLFDVPIDSNSRSLFSVLNSSSGLFSNVLENTGLGKNYGLEVTLERYFASGYYFMATSSLFDSKYKVKDGIWRNTVYNNTYAGNILGGREIALNKKKTQFWVLNSRLMWRGGNRFIPINLPESIKKNTTINDNSKAYVPRLPDYWRIDFGIAYKINKVGNSWTLSADLQNVTNRKNKIQEKYNTTTKQLYYNYGLPLVPILSFRCDF